MRPPVTSPDRHRDQDDGDGDDDDGDRNCTDWLPPQDDDGAPRSSDRGAVFSSAAAPAACQNRDDDDGDDEDVAPDLDDSNGQGDFDDADDAHHLTPSALMTDARLADEDESDFDSGSDDTYTHDPAYYLQNDLDMGDSDGGAPLDEIIVATNILTSMNFDFDAELGLFIGSNGHGGPADDTYSDDDDDDDDDDNDETAAPPAHHPDAFPPPFPFAFGLPSSHSAPATMNPGLPAGSWATNLPADDDDHDYLDEDVPTIFVPHEPQSPFFDNFIDNLPPVQLSNPNPTILGSENLGLIDFLREWAHDGCFLPGYRQMRPPHLHQVHEQSRAEVHDVTYSDLMGDQCDFQGLNWASMETTRAAARRRRRHTYRNYVNQSGSDNWTVSGMVYKALCLMEAVADLACQRQPKWDDRCIPSKDSFVRFRRMNFRPDVSLAHFQLRSVLACPSRTKAYYSSPSGINRMNLASKKTDLVMNLREFPALGGVISTLDADCGVLMGGTFNGDYCLKSLDSDDKKEFSEGQISHDGITNHLKIHMPRRSSRPVASIASNDRGFRVMDIETEKLTSQTMYPFALNCSALSPDRRLRVVVGDNPNVLITNADTGEILQELKGHRDYGFACDWSDDGWTVATGFQDKAVKIWDARKWRNSSGVSTALCTVRSEMAGVRGLRFSPQGSGKPVLVAAEEADFISVIDAQTFCTKQTIDVFSEIGGLAFTNEGQDLNILCCDAHRGGLLQLERCGRGPEPLLENAWLRHTAPYPWLVGRGYEETEWPDKWSRGRMPTVLEGPGTF
ncbi:Putative WD repeat-containing protein [Tolypocladium paradoxum]|uniref:WD repeat-containing protein n=1 Tax=Tolypocladium paradoxum TaxID=94208 RepID=A0A2S4KZN6_9HYPO|nr:Putative WD repeat-containing protein [Tolypocladium paradoxum]